MPSSANFIPQLVRTFPESRPKRIATLAALLAVISAVYALTPDGYPIISALAKHLFFLPLTLAGLWFGWTGGLTAAAISAPILVGLSLMSGRELNREDVFAEALDLLVVGGILGYLGFRERLKKQQLERNAAELARVNTELAGSVEQVKHSVRLAAVGQLAASLAHELRNPLASVEGATDLLRQNNLPAETRDEFFDIVNKECRRMNRLLTDLLEFAKPRLPQFQTIEIGPVVNDIVRLIGAPAAKSGIVVKVAVDTDLPQVQADPEQLKQVLMNLTLNAVQATVGQGEIRIRVERTLEGVQVNVRDQGSGIESAALERIFHPFFTTKAQGSGLGLPVAQEIIDRHGGQLTAHRNPDRGMTFSFWLPGLAVTSESKKVNAGRSAS
jgi:two-component system, NtrC family, sensor histidine kinase HydH